jgi:ferritin-like metal-binding protein YciE
MKIDGPRQLLISELREMLYVENTLADEALPELAGQVKSSEFKHDLEHHRDETKQHVANIERAFELLGEDASAEKSHSIDGLVAQHDKIVKNIESDELRDLFNAGAAAKTEHLEIAAYKGMIPTAEKLGEQEIVRLLTENLEQEKQALEKVEAASAELIKQAAAA